MSTQLLLEGGDLAELMLRVRTDFGPAARIVRAERIRSGGLGGFFARERYELMVDVPDEPFARPRAARLPGTHREGLVGIDALLAAADAAEVRAQIGGVVKQGAWAPAAASPPVVSTGAEAFASVLEQVRAMAGGSDRAGARGEDPVVRGTTRAALRDLGVPERVLAGAGVEEPAPLSMLLANVPVAPDLPCDPGSVVVVVGIGGNAEAVGTQLSERLRLDPSAIVLAGQGEPSAGRVRRLSDASAAARWRAGPEARHIRIVALAVGPDARGRAEASELLAALDPDQVWGVVDARTKPRDSVRWLTEVGSRRIVDALAVRGLFETTQPGTVLDLGIPVAWFDGIPATDVAWVAALTQRLQPDAPGD